MNENTPLLEVASLSTHYVNRQTGRVSRALDEVSFTLDSGEALGVVGESGSGKSTLALSLLRLLPPSAQHAGGQVKLKGDDLTAKSPFEMQSIRGKQVAMILQDPMTSLNPLFTIGDQVSEPLRIHKHESRRQAEAHAIDLLSDVRISAPERRVREFPHQMSGGMRQRIVGAIAMACRPDLLIADEPTTSLDLTIQAQYLELLEELQKQYGLALIVITHNLGIVAEMCDRVAVMYAGRIVEIGDVKVIFDNPAHPYTAALIRSIPRMSREKGRLDVIDGQPPDPANLPSGCSFHPRCPFAMDICRTKEPPDFEVAPRHRARCWLQDEQVLQAEGRDAGPTQTLSGATA